VDTVVQSNSKSINPLLNQLVGQRFFQYFKLDLFTDCPFWVSEQFCGEGGCAICECDQDEVPLFWKQSKTDLVSVQTPPNFVAWNDVEDNMWILEGHDKEMSYVNLAMYPEGNTDYDGRRIWNRIYNENCFTGEIDSMCLEERVFYRLISGLHASINTHIAKNFFLDPNTKMYSPNLELFKDRLQKYPERIQNLYFAYLFLLRAVSKAAPVLEQYDYNTGNAVESAEVRKLMKQLLTTDLLCSPNFDESVLFNDPVKGQDIKQQFKQHFRNISLIMNCVSCEKCKVYAKLQTLAIGTALKILFAADTNAVINQLQRNEIIALINTLRQFSTSIEAIHTLNNLVASTKNTQQMQIGNNTPLSILLPNATYATTTTTTTSVVLCLAVMLIVYIVVIKRQSGLDKVK